MTITVLYNNGVIPVTIAVLYNSCDSDMDVLADVLPVTIAVTITVLYNSYDSDCWMYYRLQ